MVGLHSLVAERRHSSVTRYAKRSVACRDSPRHQPLRAGGTPLPHHRRLPHPSDCPIGAIHRHRRKTAEERFHTLARGWLAYPVTSMHAHLPPKSGCINVIPRFALSRRRATALFHNPVRKAQRSVPGFSSTPTSACRRYATSPPSAVASHIIRHPSDCPIVAMHHRHRRKTAEERFHTLAQGWLAYPVTPGCTHIYRRRAVVEKKTDGWDSNHRSLYRYVLLCDYLLTTRRSLIRAFLPVRLRR